MLCRSKVYISGSILPSLAQSVRFLFNPPLLYSVRKMFSELPAIKEMMLSWRLYDQAAVLQALEPRGLGLSGSPLLPGVSADAGG